MIGKKICNEEIKWGNSRYFPTYNQLKGTLLNKILSGEWNNGEKIPNPLSPLTALDTFMSSLTNLEDLSVVKLIYTL
jgi:hypothetical protein